MDEKDKLNNEKQENDNKDQNNSEKKDSEKLGIDPELLDRIVTELEEKYDLKKEDIKILKIDKDMKRKKTILKDFLFWAFDFLLIISLHGYLSFSEPNILKLLLYSIVFYIIELTIRIILNKYYQKLVFYSFGLIMVPVTIIALLLANMVVGLKFIDNDKMILFFILFIIARVMLRFVLMRKEIQTLLKGRKK